MEGVNEPGGQQGSESRGAPEFMGPAPHGLGAQEHSGPSPAPGGTMPSVLPAGGAANGTSPPPLKAVQRSPAPGGPAAKSLQGGAAAGAAQAAAGVAPAEAAAASGLAPQQAVVPTPLAQAAPAAPAVSPAARPAAGQQQQAAAAGAAPAAAGAAAAPGPPASPGAVAAAEVEALLARLMQLDVEGWFRHPVRERDAPNYYKIIKHPMCFEIMRGKIRGRQYSSWTELVRDFELICSNATKYNQKRSRVHKAALVMLRAGKKVLAEIDLEGRRAMSALVAASALPMPSSLHVTPPDSLAGPSSLYRSGTAGTGLLRSQSVADTATTEGDSEAMQIDGPAEDEADPAGYSSFEETDMEDDVAEARQAQRAQQLLDAAARDAVLAQPWPWLGPAGGAASAAAGGATAPEAGPGAQQERQQQQGQQQAKGQEHLQRDQQSPTAAGAAAAAAAAAPAHSQEWKAARRSVEWRARWLEHRLTELHHQRLRYQQQLAAEEQREAQQEQQAGKQAAPGGKPSPAAAAAAAAPAVKQEKQQQKVEKQQQQAAATAAAQPKQEKQQQAWQAGPAAANHAAAGAAAAEADKLAAAASPAQPAAAAPRQWKHRPHRELGECQLPGLLQHPFIAAHSSLGVRPAGGASSVPGLDLPAAMDCDDFPAEVHAALELLDHKLSSLRRQLVALQRPGAQAALQRVQSVRVHGYRGPGGARRGGGATPRGTPRSGGGLGSIYREGSLGKRRRVPEYDVGEVITPLGAPKFVERAQVKTIDTPRVRPLPNTEIKRRQAALEAFTSQKKQGADDKAALEAIDALCPGESSEEEDTSDQAFMARHQKMEAAERARYEAVLGAAVKRNKQQSKVGKGERIKQPGSARASVARTVSAPAFVGTGTAAAAAAAAASVPVSPRLSSPASGVLPGAASAPAAAMLGPAGSAPSPGPAAAAKAADGGTPSSAGLASGAAAGGNPDAAVAAEPGSQQAALAQQQQQQQAAAAAPSAKGAADGPGGASAAAAGGGASLAGANGMPLVMLPLNAAMAQQMAQMAAMAAVANQAGKGSNAGAAGAAPPPAVSSPLLRPPFTLPPAMAAAMAAAGTGGLSSVQQAAMRQAAGAAMAMAAAAADMPLPPMPAPLPAALHGLPNGGGHGPANGGSSGRSRGRPRKAGRPRR